ncbi:hypothetical protein Y032_0131g1574 [Ancylostoma ceylanicum]|uniref:DDE Tnp4 domain-containing protein n=1 Tax=Ancylostoma ceylanicum TaxID=53326 RepID=A0A016T6R4_9BILA|nr:hypothetical protein Y032_0131g1574 [Ancylostoma ceylanicum]
MNSRLSPFLWRWPTTKQCADFVLAWSSFGQLKRKFHALHRGLRYSPQRSSALIANAICLRNVAVRRRQPEFQDDSDSDGSENKDFEDSSDEEDKGYDSATTMHANVNNYFS